MTSDAPTLQDVLRQRQREDFVGRDGPLAEFTANLGFTATDPRRKFIVNIHGVAGVGKTFLTQRYRRLAEAAGAACAYVDEDCFDAVETMAAIATDFGDQGIRLPGFETQLATYRQRRHEMESDPQAPLADLVTSASVKVGMSMAKTIPLAGAAAEVLDPDAVAAQLNRLRAYLGQRFGKKADVDLLLKPVEVLTRAFVAGLGEVAADRMTVLIFDTFERTGAFLEEWLLDLFGGKYGFLSANLVVVIAGQHPLPDNRWSALRSLIAVHPLESFTEGEARDFLSQRGVADPEVVQMIFALSGRVPMWLATLADNSPQEPGSVPDPSEGAVERFLKWEPDEKRKRVARLGALPRRINHDILAAVLDGAGEVEAMFDWLCGLPFVSRGADHWRYHDAVKDAMLRLERSRSPQQWREMHQRLADYFATERAALGMSDDDGWEDPTWQTLLLEDHFHRLCAAPTGALGSALEQAVRATGEGMSLTRRWAAMLTAAGRAADAERIRVLGDRLTELLQGDDDVAFLSALIDSGELGPAGRTAALAACGESHRLIEQFDAALNYLTQAIALVPDSALFHQRRGATLREMKRFDEALADFDKSIELDPANAWAFAMRALTYRDLHRSDEALADFGHAIDLDSGSDWILAERGLTLLSLERYDQALDDLDRAIELDPEYSWAIAQRGMVYRLLGRDEEALADFGRTIELDPDNSWAIADRGMVHRLLGRYDEALTDLDRAIQISPEYGWAIAQRGMTYQDLQRYDQALADLDRAVELDRTDGWAIALRGMTYRFLERYDAALADLDRAVELDPDNNWILAERGGVRWRVERYDEALADLDRAIELDPEYNWALAERGRVLRRLGRYDEALADLERAVELDPDDGWATTRYGFVHLAKGHYSEALEKFDRAIELGSDDIIGHRGWAQALLGHYGKAHLDLDRAIELGPSDSWWRFLKACTTICAGERAEGLRQVRIAIDLARSEIMAEPETATHRFNLIVYRATAGETSEARRLFDELVRSSPLPHHATDFLEDLDQIRGVPGVDLEMIDGLARDASAYRADRLAAQEAEPQ